MKKDKWWLVGVSFLIILFGILTYLVINDYARIIDNGVYNFIHSFSSPLLDKFMKVYTQLAGPTILFCIALSLWYIFRKKKGILIFINLCLVFILNTIVKVIIGRERPIDINLITETGYSFPSGHAMVSMAFYGYIAYMIGQKLKKKRWLSYTVCGLLILFIGISRVYLGVHFATDILAGWTAGLLFLICFIKFSQNKRIN